MICPNCGRRNSGGATFCSRCRQRLPLATKLNGNQRRTQMVEPRGGGGSGAIVLGVALLAGFLFIGGAAAIYLSNPAASPGDGTFIAGASSTPSLPIFVQPTATPSPTPSPTFILLPSESPTSSFTPLPTATSSLQPTVQPSSGPATPTPVRARFTFTKSGFKVQFNDQSRGAPTEWLWDFGDETPTSAEQNPKHTYEAGVFKTYTVKLIVTGPGGTSTITKNVTFEAPPTPTPTPSPTAEPSVTPPPTPSFASPTTGIVTDSPESPTP